MAASKFDRVHLGFLELIADQVPFKDACREVGVQPKTVRNWLAQGRGGDERYAEFAAAFDASKEEIEQREAPMDREELLLAVSKAARKGSVQAMKLMEEMLRRGNDDPNEEQDGFEELDAEDELAAKREEKAS